MKIRKWFVYVFIALSMAAPLAGLTGCGSSSTSGGGASLSGSGK